MAIIKKITFYLFISLFLLICFFTFTIFTSLMSKQLPWYEPCGMQFMAILIISCPALFVLGIAYTIFGDSISAGKLAKGLPYLTLIIIGSLVLIDGSLGSLMQIAGATTCVIASGLAIFLGIRDQKDNNKNANKALNIDRGNSPASS